MCRFSVVNSETEVAQAEINQCLGIRLRLYASPTRRATNWIVPANQLGRSNPCAVCLPSGTTVIFHDLPERIRNPFGLPREVAAVYMPAFARSALSEGVVRRGRDLPGGPHSRIENPAPGPSGAGWRLFIVGREVSDV